MTQEAEQNISPDIEQPIFRVHFWVRLLVAVLAIVETFARRQNIDHPLLAFVIDLFILGWTVFTSWRYLNERTRQRWVFRVDVLATVAVVLLSPLIIGNVGERATGITLASYWIVGAPLAVAIHRGWLPGALAGMMLGGISFVVQPWHDHKVGSDMLLMVIAAAGMGYLVDQLRYSIIDRDSYYATAAALGERERLNRIVHDGVLQVLAMVERTGPELGVKGKALAKAAKQQEINLRAMLQDRNIDVVKGDVANQRETNISVMLDAHGSDQVTIATVADDIMMDSERAKELDGVVSEVLANVAKHAGADAHAWILLEQEGTDVVISIRDNGVGTTAEQMEQAGGRGRLGVRESIHGRIRDLGGEAKLRAKPGRGVEWEFRIPAER